MVTRRKHATQSLATQAVELAVAVPQVVAHRITRMALAGPTLSPRDRREFTLMLAEKNRAFTDSWSAMVKQTMVANQALAASYLQSVLSATRGKQLSPAQAASELHKAALGVLGKGLAPVHRKATANAKRLARTKLR